jgi:hypothetical protein
MSSALMRAWLVPAQPGATAGLFRPGVAAFHHDAVAQLGHYTATALYQQTLDAIAQLRTTEPQIPTNWIGASGE